jgi:hypothetical protein
LARRVFGGNWQKLQSEVGDQKGSNRRAGDLTNFAKSRPPLEDRPSAGENQLKGGAVGSVSDLFKVWSIISIEYMNFLYLNEQCK